MAITELAWNEFSSGDHGWLELHCRADDGREKFFGCAIDGRSIDASKGELRQGAALWASQLQPRVTT